MLNSFCTFVILYSFSFLSQGLILKVKGAKKCLHKQKMSGFTIIEINDSGVSGETWIKVGH